MIGSALKKLAAEHNMNVQKGVAYGNFHGYATTFSEGAGFKLIQVTTTFPDAQKKTELQDALEKRDLMKEFRVQEALFGEDFVSIVFYDNPGTMKKLYAFVDWFFPLLDETGATKYNICTECKCEITSGHWKLINGIAFYLHDSCAEAVKRSISQQEKMQKEEDTGSYISGFLGAILGSALGAVLWAVILCIGYIASVVGFVIGWLAEKGYQLFRGKQGKGKTVILIIAVIFGVVLGTVGGEIASIVMMINSGELVDYTYGDIPYLLFFLLYDTQYLISVGGSVLIGLVFAGLGVFSMLRRTSKEVADAKIVDLP